MDAVLNVIFLVNAEKLYVEINNKHQGAYLLHKGKYALLYITD